MIKVKLTPEEKKIMKAIEADEYVPVSGKELKSVADAIAARKKDATLTIRVNSHDIDRIKEMATQKGIPYQSYLSEVIHRVAEAL
jgi:predicted DNA binding CopG/RHH family protein